MGDCVLIIDDSETIRKKVREVFEAENMFSEYLMASDGMEGFKHLVTNKDKVDLILCDVVMPKFDGFKFLTLKTSKPDFAEIPVIMLTGQDDVETKVKSLTSGAQDYLTKPFHDQELIARVAIHKKLKKLQDEMREKNARLEEMNRTDALTKLANRRFFMESFSREYERAKRYGEPLSYVMCDLDKFKSVNDNYGHIAGDNALVVAAKVLKDTLRTNDLPGRYGGEEFGMLLPETDAEGACIVADRCREIIEQTPVQTDQGPINITISMGVSTFYPSREEHPTISKLIDLADGALYEAKEGGRNRVVIESTSLKP